MRANAAIAIVLCSLTELLYATHAEIANDYSKHFEVIREKKNVEKEWKSGERTKRSGVKKELKEKSSSLLKILILFYFFLFRVLPPPPSL